MIYSPAFQTQKEEAWGIEKKQERGSERAKRETGSPLESLHLHALELARLMFWKTRIGGSRIPRMAPRDWI